MPEVADAREHHRKARFVGGPDDIVVLHALNAFEQDPIGDGEAGSHDE